MDGNNPQLVRLLNDTDQAFQRLLEDPESLELNNAYEHAKEALDGYLLKLRHSLKKRYKDF